MKRMREKISLNLLATEYLTKLAGLESDSIIGELNCTVPILMKKNCQRL